MKSGFGHKSGLGRYCFTVFSMLAAGICAADDAILSRKTEAPQPARRYHYVNPPIPVRTATARQVAVPVKNPRELRLDLGTSSSAAWTLDQVIAATLTSDPRLHIGKEEIRQAKAEHVSSSLIPNPEFSAAGGVLPFSRNRITEDSPGGPPELSLAVDFPIDWFLFAKRKAEMNNTKWEIRQAHAEYADLIRSRIMETAALFYDVLEAKALFAVANQEVEILAQLEGIAKGGVEAGGMPVVELKRITLDLLQIRQELLVSEKELDVLKAQLRAQFGCTDYDPEFDITGDLDAATDKDPMPLETAFEMARLSRPDIRALLINVSKSKANVHLEQRHAYPEITAHTEYVRQYQKASGDNDYNGWGIGVTVSVPLFDRNQGNRLKARSALTQSTHQYQAGIADLRAEIVEADRNFRTAHQQVHTIAWEEVLLSAEVRDMMIAAFMTGGVPLIDVLDAERSYQETVRMFITSRADYWRALYIYNSVVGINSANDIRADRH